MLIKYYKDGTLFARRIRDLVPRQGEIIRFGGELYLIETVVWLEYELGPHVAIDIKPTV